MALPENIVKNMRKFQEPNNLPVFLKGGPVDKVLFGISVALAGVGLMTVGKFVYDMTFKRKNA